MKVYVDELPKSCEECPMCRSGKLKLQRKGRYVEAKQCVFGQYKYQTIDYEIDTCPLKSLSDYTKQVRKEVVEFIDKCFEMQKYESIWINPDKTEFSCDVGYAYEWWESFRKILLDQIQGE